MIFRIVLKIFREGILAALMGGFYIDFSDNAHFINIVHIYLWFFLFGMPIIIAMDYSNSIPAIVLTSLATAVVVLIIKLITNRLHFLFDTSEAIEIVKKDENNKETSFNYPFGYNSEDVQRASAIDQESMFPGGSIEDIENGQVQRDSNVGGDQHDKDKMAVKDIENQSNNYPFHYGRVYHIIPQQNQTGQPTNVNNNLKRNPSTDLCILEQVSRRPSFTRPLARLSSARFKIIDNPRKNSMPLVPLQHGVFKTNICLTERYPKLASHRSNIDYCRTELQKMNEEINQLNIAKIDNFEPSTADLALLDRSEPNRRSVKSISRSRSSSQRYCHSIHLNPAGNPTGAAVRVGSMRAGMLAKLSPDPSGNTKGIRPKRASISGAVPVQSNITTGNAAPTKTIVRKLSVPHVRHRRTSFSQSYPPMTPGVIRSHSVRGGNQTHLIRRRMSTTDDYAKGRRSSFKLDPQPPMLLENYHRNESGSEITITTTQQASTIGSRRASFTMAHNASVRQRRREFRAASIDVPYLPGTLSAAGNTGSSVVGPPSGACSRPVFTIGGYPDEYGVAPNSIIQQTPKTTLVRTSSIRRKASFDTKSRSFDIPDDIYVPRCKTKSSLMLMTNKSDEKQQHPQTQKKFGGFQQPQKKSASIKARRKSIATTTTIEEKEQPIPRRKSIGLTRSNAIMETQASTNSDEEDEENSTKPQEKSEIEEESELSNLMDDMLASKRYEVEPGPLFRRSSSKRVRGSGLVLTGAGGGTGDEDGAMKNSPMLFRVGSMTVQKRDLEEDVEEKDEDDQLSGKGNVNKSNNLPVAMDQMFTNIRENAFTDDNPPQNELSEIEITMQNTLREQQQQQQRIAAQQAASAASKQQDNYHASTKLPYSPLDIINPAAHDDTSEGSVHLFQDVSGDWMVYVFGDSTGAASVTPIETYLKKRHLQERRQNELNNAVGLPGSTLIRRRSNYGQGPSNMGAASSSAFTDSMYHPRADSPHPDFVAHDVPVTASVHSRTGRYPTAVTDGTSSNRRSEQMDPHNHGAGSSSKLHPLVGPGGASSSNLRRISNHGSMEQISLLDRILMTSNDSGGGNHGGSSSAGNTGGGAGGGSSSGGPGSRIVLSSEQFDFFHSIFTGGGNAGTSAGATADNTNQIAGSGGIDQSRLSLSGDTAGAGSGAATSLQDDVLLYEAIKKWFMCDKPPTVTKQYYYELQLLPWSPKKFRVNFDRLQLTSLFDRSNSKLEIVLVTILTALVSLIGLILLSRRLYFDFSLWCVCFTMAAAQYSLVKSVQPDACSPQHGFNRMLLFNRAVYFCLIAGSILVLEKIHDHLPPSSNQIRIFGMVISLVRCIRGMSWFLQYLLLFVPILHMLGWLPQLNTMLLYVIEQFDIHLWGSSGNSDIFSGIFSLTRNVMGASAVYALCYFCLESKNPQHICNSIFWGLHLSTCYFLSRLPNSLELYGYVWEAFRGLFIPLKRWKDCTNCDCTNAETDDNKQSKLVADIELATVASPPTIVTPRPVIRKFRKPSDSSKIPTTHKEWLLGSINPPSNPPIEMRDLSGNKNEEETNDNNSNNNNQNSNNTNLVDPLPGQIKHNLVSRIKNDLLVCIIWGVLGFAMHISSLFSQQHLQWIVRPLLVYMSVAVGFTLHYLWPQLCKPYPWLLFAKSWIQVSTLGTVTKWEGFHYWLLWLQKNIFIPLLVMNEYSNAVVPIQAKFGSGFGSVILIISSMKLLRFSFQANPRLYFIILLTHLLFQYDFKYWNIDEQFPLNFMAVSIVFSRLYEFWLKMNFVYIYIAPFQISWGSAFHAIAQLAFLPHSMFLVTQCVISSLISAPLEPFLASAIFISSYVRPIKFWEKKYRTQRLETTNTTLSTQVQGISSEQVAGNLNSIFYEHLTRSLQKRLAGDLLLGRWGGEVEGGDMFILASEDLHFLVHIIEMGNGLVTFQLRGLEFAGTYCHEQETEELRTDLVKSSGFCCCNPGRLPCCLSLNVAFRLRWVAWQFVQNPYCLEGYRVTDHSASTTVQFFELRRLIVTLFVQCIIYKLVASVDDLIGLLTRLSKTALVPLSQVECMDLDPVFNRAFDEDYDESVTGVTRRRFLSVHANWIKYCVEKQPPEKQALINKDDNRNLLNSLCFGLSLVGRRSLGYTTTNKSAFYQQTLTDVFLHGLHDVFKGDVRVSKDDWIFEEVTLLQSVITPAVRIGLKLYQDNLANPLSTMSDLYTAIVHTETTHIICHETEPQWRFAILNDAESLFSFRRIVKPNSGDGYRIIMFNKNELHFNVIKINRECVRGLWSSQQREQIFLRNNDQERGSIQHSRQVLRNLVNSSCDLPIGYPIYVSPLTTSLAGSHEPLRSVAGRELSLGGLWRRLRWMWHRFRYHSRCAATNSHTSTIVDDNIPPSTASATNNTPTTTGQQQHGLVTAGGNASGGNIGLNSSQGMLASAANLAAGKADQLMHNISTSSLSSLRQLDHRYILAELEHHFKTQQQQYPHHHHHTGRQTPSACSLAISTTAGHSQRSSSVDDGIIVAGSLLGGLRSSLLQQQREQHQQQQQKDKNSPAPPPPPSILNPAIHPVYTRLPRPSLPVNTLCTLGELVSAAGSEISGTSSTTGALVPGSVSAHPETTVKMLKISDATQILNRWHDKLQWPPEHPHVEYRNRILTTTPVSTVSTKGTSHNNTITKEQLQGRQGTIIHKWTPFNPITSSRSFCHLTIVLFSLSPVTTGNVSGVNNTLAPSAKSDTKLALINNDVKEKCVLIFEQGISDVTNNSNRILEDSADKMSIQKADIEL